jgi:nucleoside-diphosphate-sugar epimerase
LCGHSAMVWGPCLAKAHAKASPFVFRQALYGNDQPNGQFSVVDVRDVALAHVLAMEKPEANGKRFILDGDGYHSDSLRGNVIAVNDVIAKCREYFPDYQFTDAPGENPAAIKPGFRTTDNTLSKEVLGLEYTDMGETFKDSVSSMVDNGFVPAKPAAKL